MNGKLNTLAIAGNPNCGKTTLFNALTGGNQRIGNWPGVTVEKKEGSLKLRTGTVTVVDLPGIYSLSAASEDERVARDFLLEGSADLVLNIIDGTNLERNLYLTTQLIEMKVPFVVLINMMDIVKRKGITIDSQHLSKHLGVPVMEISATKAADITMVKGALEEHSFALAASPARIEYPAELEKSLSKISSRIGEDVDPRFAALSLMEGDPVITARMIAAGSVAAADIAAERKRVEEASGDTIDMLIADARYGFIHGVTREVITRRKLSYSLTNRIDSIVLNRFLGIPIFLGMMYLMFWFSISVGGAFIDFFDIAFGAVFVDGFGALLSSWGASDILVTFLAKGIGGGIQTVATFIPIIFGMFFALSILEDSGYMARAAFVVDRFMRMLGLPGKAFVSMIIGFGCTVPAVMSTRTLESKRDRMLVLFMSPLMSCGARLPVYVLFAAAFFPASSGLLVFSIYLVGLILAVLTGVLLRKTLLAGEASHFVMELPPYHAPRMSHILLHTWNRLKLFVLRASAVIITAVVILSFFHSLGTDGTFGNEGTQKSVLARVSRAITPVLEPMGIEEENWPATVGIFTGIFAKEAVVGTLNSLYATKSAAADEIAADEEPFSLVDGLLEACATVPANLSGVLDSLADPLGLGSLDAAEDESAAAEELETDAGIFAQMKAHFTKGKWQVYAYLLFVLIYFPCAAALGAIVRETGIAFGLGIAVYLTVLGWIVATLFYQIAVGHDPLWITVAASGIVLIGIIMKLLGYRKKTQ